MSALPIPPPVAERWSTKFTAACFTPKSLFDRWLDIPQYSALLCLCLIIAKTLGEKGKPDYAKIYDEEFTDLTRVSKEQVDAALKYLESVGLIYIGREATPGCTIYTLRKELAKEAQDAGRKRVRGRCPDCKAIGEFETRFIPVPYVALRKLGACIPSAVFRVVMFIISKTLIWNSEEFCLDVKPAELQKNDFERYCGIEDRQLSNAIGEALKLGLIGREYQQGERYAKYWVNPEEFAKLERRAPRTVTQPTSAVVEKAKPEPHKNEQISHESEPAPVNESRTYFYGQCPSCKHFVDVEPVTDEEFTEHAIEKPPRAGPTRETRLPKPQILSSFETFKGFK